MNSAINQENLGSIMYPGIDTKHQALTTKWYEANGFGTEFSRPTPAQSVVIKKGLAQVQTTLKFLLTNVPKDSAYAAQIVSGMRYALDAFKGGIVGGKLPSNS